MRFGLAALRRLCSIGGLLLVSLPAAVAYEMISFGPPGPTGYGEFFQSEQSPASDPSCLACVDGGVSVFNGTDLDDAYDAWLASVFANHGVLPGSFFGEDFDAPGWTHDQVFDSQETPSGAPPFADGVTMSNDLPDVPGRAEEPAKADRTPGSSPAIDRLAWEARDEFDPDTGSEPEATIDFSVNYTDFLSFYIFDASATGVFYLEYTDGTIFSFENKPTANQNDDDEGFYRFIGFVNTHDSAQMERFWVTNAGSRYGIDEIEWGRGDEIDVPEPITLWLVSAGLAMGLYRRRRARLPGS